MSLYPYTCSLNKFHAVQIGVNIQMPLTTQKENGIRPDPQAILSYKHQAALSSYCESVQQQRGELS